MSEINHQERERATRENVINVLAYGTSFLVSAFVAYQVYTKSRSAWTAGLVFSAVSMCQFSSFLLVAMYRICF